MTARFTYRHLVELVGDDELIAWLVDVLAPTFGGQRDPLRALKLTAYSYTAAWVAGILQIVPALGVLALLAGCYGLYLLYLGLPVLMRCPKEKSLGYTIVLILCAIVVSAVIGILSTCAATGLGLAGIGAMGRLNGAVLPSTTGFSIRLVKRGGTPYLTSRKWRATPINSKR